MNWMVHWQLPAEQRLANLWNNATDRQAIADAANRIDAILKLAPETAGEERANGQRVLLEPPLGVIYRVEPDDRIVWVRAVWSF